MSTLQVLCNPKNNEDEQSLNAFDIDLDDDLDDDYRRDLREIAEKRKALTIDVNKINDDINNEISTINARKSKSLDTAKKLEAFELNKKYDNAIEM